MAKQFVIYDDSEVYTEEDAIESADQYEWVEDNLNITTKGDIVCIAQMGLWNGTRIGYKVGSNNVNEVLSMGNYDYNTLYVDAYNVCKSSSHHDGTNSYIFRELKPELSETQIENFLNKVYNMRTLDKKVLSRYTNSLKPYVEKVYNV